MQQSTGDRVRGVRRALGRQPSPEPEKRPARGRWTLVKETAGILVTALVVSLIIKTLLIQVFFIPSGSMEPTLHGCKDCLGDRVIVNKLTNRMGGVHRGDVVVFRDSDGWLTPPAHKPGTGGQIGAALAMIGLAPTTTEGDLVKRIIGVGGDTVEARDNKVYVNGSQLNEPYIVPGDSPSTIDFRVTVPTGTLWVMGDHRSESADSRFHMQDPGKGFVPLADVIGQVVVIIWPLDRVGTLDRPATFDRIAAAPKP